ncbi:MAG: DUF6165 family protein [Rhizobiaceae bacterium]
MPTKPIMVEIAPGELLDKISILEIKNERITDAAKRANVRIELDLLCAARDREITPSAALDNLYASLKQVNEALWEIEDGIRDEERDRRFGERFVELARSVYHTNDKRAALKREINTLLGSAIVEEKSYSNYA